MKRKVRILKVPQCGYVVIGRGTYHEGQIVDASAVDPEEVKNLLQDGYIEEIGERSLPPEAKA